MTIFVLTGGLLLVKKIRREKMVLGFAIATIFTMATLGPIGWNAVFSSSLLFFAFVMLTEPITSPTTEKMQIIYGIGTGILFAPQLKILGVALAPEQVLLLGNLFTYVTGPREKLVLNLKERIKIASDIYDFVFDKPARFSFIPGQYMEWTLPHDKTDSRGNRRYFTLASSPTENTIRLGIKFPNAGSSYKKRMLEINNGATVTASQGSGDFVLPGNPSEKLVFIAGGIGVTPFRSMVKYLTDTGQKRDIVLMYSCNKEADFVYKEIFVNIKTVYTVGRISEEQIRKEVPDFALRKFYLSGPRGMVMGFKDMLRTARVSNNRIITDYFPGFA